MFSSFRVSPILWLTAWLLMSALGGAGSYAQGPAPGGDAARQDSLTTAALAQPEAEAAEVEAAMATEESAATASPVASAAEVSGEKDLVFVIPVEDEFEKALYLIMVRAMREARRAGADAVVLDMNTFGGRVDAAINIRDLLIESTIPTYTYVNNKAISAGAFIAVATDTIVMGPTSSIGGALPITVGADGAKGADEKFLSVFKAEMRKTAKAKGHPEDITDGFCNPKRVIPGLKEEGEILTLDYDEATSVGLAAFQAATLDEMLDKAGYGNAEIRHFKLTSADKLARILSSQAIAGILMLIGMGGLFLELKTPGVGLPGAVGATALILYFFGSYLANLSGYMEWVIFMIGVVLLIVEIYVLPGFGVAGITGLILIIGSLFFALVNLAPDQGFSFTGVRSDLLVAPAMTIFVVLLAVVPFLMLIAKILPATPFYSKLVLEERKEEATSAATAVLTGESVQGEENAIKVGDRGEAVTDCYPTGVAMLRRRRVEVISEGELIDRKEALVVARMEAGHIYVNRMPGPGTESDQA